MDAGARGSTRRNFVRRYTWSRKLGQIRLQASDPPSPRASTPAPAFLTLRPRLPRHLAGPTHTMTTAGEAASLFGSPDAALDPFAAALGGDDTREQTHGNVTASDGVADLFGSATDSFPVDGGDALGAVGTEAQQTWYDPAGQQNYGYSAPAPAVNSYAPAYPEQQAYPQQNGTYASYSQPQYGSTAAPAVSGGIPCMWLLDLTLMNILQRTSRPTLSSRAMRHKRTPRTARSRLRMHRRPQSSRHQQRRRVRMALPGMTRTSRRGPSQVTTLPPILRHLQRMHPRHIRRTTRTNRHTLLHLSATNPLRSRALTLLTRQVRTARHTGLLLYPFHRLQLPL